MSWLYKEKPKKRSWFSQGDEDNGKCRHCGDPTTDHEGICSDCRESLNSGSGEHGRNREEDIDPMESGDD